MAVKARQLARSAKAAKYKRELKEAGVSLVLPPPSKQAMEEKEKELLGLFKELFPKKGEEKQQESVGESKEQDELIEKHEDQSDSKTTSDETKPSHEE